MNKMLIVAFLTGSTVLRAQSLDIDFGSTFDEESPFPALRFADADGIRFDTNLGGETGIITVGYFDDIETQNTFTEYFADFTQAGTESVFIAGEEGYLQASTSTTIPIPSNTKPYVFVFGGVSDFADAASATSYSIYGDTSLSDFPSLNTPASTLNLLTLQPDDVVVGNLVSVTDGFDLVASQVPEPSTYALWAGLLMLGYLIVRRSLVNSINNANSNKHIS